MNQDKINKIFTFSFLLLVLIGLIALLVPSFYLRWYADDYCIAAQLRSTTFSQYFVEKYMGWTGRYGSILFQGAYAQLGYKASAVLPSLMVLAWFVALTWAVIPTLRMRIGKFSFALSMAVSGFILLCTYSITPNLFQSVFWNNAAISVCLPLIFITVTLGILARGWEGKHQRRSWMPAVIVLTLLAGGFAEMFIAMQVSLFALMVFLAFFTKDEDKKKRILPYLWAGFGSAIVAFVIVAIAPGNLVRQSQIGQPASLTRLPGMLVKYVYMLLADMADRAGWWTLVMVTVPFLFGLVTLGKSESLKTSHGGLHQKASKKIGQVLLIGVVLIVLLLAAVAPSTYIQQQEPEARSVLIAIYFIVTGICMITWVIGTIFRETSRINKIVHSGYWQLGLKFLIVLIIGISTGYTLSNAAKTTPIYKDYAELWDERHQDVLMDIASGKQNITTFQLDDTQWGVSDIRDDPSYWVNHCMAAYYEVESITSDQVR